MVRIVSLAAVTWCLLCPLCGDVSAYYNQSLGRWMSEDSWGTDPGGRDINPLNTHMVYADGMSLYQYSGSQPNVIMDPIGSGFWSFVDCFNACIEDNDPIHLALNAAVAHLLAGPLPKTQVAAIARALGDDELANKILVTLKRPGADPFTTLPSALSVKIRAGSRSTLRMLGRVSSRTVGPVTVAYGLALAVVEVHCTGICSGCQWHDLDYSHEMNILDSLNDYFK
jgi:hypothetical protein